MPVSGKKMVKLFIKAGWRLDHINGSHHIMKKGIYQMGWKENY